MSSSTYGQPVSASADVMRRDREKRETCLCPPPRRCPGLDFYPRNVLQRNSVASGRFLPATELKKREKPIICRIRESQTEFYSFRKKWNSKTITIITVKTLFLDRQIGILGNIHIYATHIVSTWYHICANTVNHWSLTNDTPAAIFARFSIICHPREISLLRTNEENVINRILGTWYKWTLANDSDSKF